MTQPIPTAGPLIDWLRNEARQPFEQPRGDVGDQVPLQWLLPVAQRDSRVAFAIEHLVREADSLVAARLLRLAILPETPPTVKSAIARALGNGGARNLASVDAGSGFSLLGLAVRTMRLPRETGAISANALAALHDIVDRKDGWPTSIAVGLTSNPSQFVDVLEASSARLSDADAAEIAFVLLQADESRIAAALREITRATSPTTRARIGAAIKQDLDESEAARQQMLNMGVKLSPLEPTADRWNRYAQQLGIAP
jgi:hypothetical protein